MTIHPGAVLLKGEVLGSSNTKRTNNLVVDVVSCRAVSQVPSKRDGLSHIDSTTARALTRLHWKCVENQKV